MDNLFEIIVPLIFAAIYFFGNMLSGKSDEDEAPGSAPRRGEEDPDAAERQRRIQEEIRRKIMERRNKQGEGGRPRSPLTSESSSPTQPASEADRSLRERRAAVEERRRQREIARRSEQSQQRAEPAAPEADLSRTPDPAPRNSDTAFNWDKSDDVYSNQMQERLKQIEATKQQAAKLQKQAKASREKLKGSGAQGSSSRGRSSGARLSGPVRGQLRDPAAARAAFIYGEVLGPPVSQRKTPTVPGLS